MTAGMHDHPGIWPVLPGRTPTADERALMIDPVIGTEWQACWEYKLTHELTEGEGAAFWNGAHLGMLAGRRTASAVVCDQIEQRIKQLIPTNPYVETALNAVVGDVMAVLRGVRAAMEANGA